MTTEPKHGLKRCTVREYYPNANGGRFGEATPPYTDEVCVLASEADALIDAKDAEIAGLRLDAELGRVAMQFVDRAGDVCKEDPAERICDEFNIAMAATVELHRRAARSKQEKRDE